MTELANFFTEKGASLGSVFYPNDFLVATVPSSQAARDSAEALGNAGISENNRKAVSSEEMLEFFQEFRAQAGASGGAVRALSRFIDTEAKYADADIAKALQGHGFVVVRSETTENARLVASVIAPFQPVSIEWYRASGVESLL